MAEELQYIQVDGEYIAFPASMSDEDIATAIKSAPARQESPVGTAPPQLPADDGSFFNRLERPQVAPKQVSEPQGNPEQMAKFAEELKIKVTMGQMSPQQADNALRTFKFGSSGVAPSGGMSGPFDRASAQVPAGVSTREYFATKAVQPTISEKIVEVFTGDLRSTERSKKARDWMKMPELSEWSLDSIMANFGTTSTGGDETIKILKSRFPGITAEKDRNGNWILTSPTDGKEYAFKPGLGMSDIDRLGKQVGMELAGGTLTAAGAAGKAVLKFLNRSRGAGEFTKGAITELANQLKEYIAGGDINVDEVGAAGMFQGAGKLAEGAVKSKMDVGKFKDLADKSIQGDAGARKLMADTLATGTEQEKTALKNAMSRMGFKVDNAGKVSTGDIDMDFALQYVADTPAHKVDMNILAGAFKKNPEMIQKAKDMGVLKYMLPAELVDRKKLMSRKIADASVDADQRTQNLMELAEDLTDRMSKLGLDTGTSIGAKTRKLSDDIEDRLSKMEKNTSEGYTKLYEDIGDARFDSSEALDKVNNIIAKRGANTPPPGFKWLDDEGEELLSTDFEREILKALSTREAGLEFLSKGQGPTIDVSPKFTRLDTLRRKAGSMMGDATFSSEARGYAKEMYKILDTQAGKALKEIGGDTGLDKRWKTYKKSTEIRKGLEDNMAYTFGRQLRNDLRAKTESTIADTSKGGQAKFIDMVTALPKAERGRYVTDALMHTIGNEFNEKGFQSFGSLWKAVEKDQQIKNLLGSTLSPSQMRFFEDVGKISSTIFNTTKKKSAMTKGELLKIAEGKEAVLSRLMGDINTSIGTSIIVKGVAGAPIIGGSGSLGLSLGVLNAMKRLSGNRGKDASKTLEVLRSKEFRNLLASDLKDTDYMKFANSNKGKIWWDQIRDTSTSPNMSAFLRQLASDQPQKETKVK